VPAQHLRDSGASGAGAPRRSRPRRRLARRRAGPLASLPLSPSIAPSVLSSVHPSLSLSLSLYISLSLSLSSRADEVAIETCSLSKYAGFTGVRLGWCVVPDALLFSDGTKVNQDWNRVTTTIFNGAGQVSQDGALACLSDAGWAEMEGLVAFYKENARLLSEALRGMGWEVHGATDAPYVWARAPGGMGSWDAFSDLLERCDVVCTPGAGFGPAGEGFVRMSSFGHRDNVLEAIGRLQKAYGR